MVVIPLLFLLGSQFHCGHAEAQSSVIEMLKEAALQWQGDLTCQKWDCNCTFTRQRGCCCAANDMFKLEDDTYLRIRNLWQAVSSLNNRVHELTGAARVAFTVSMNSNMAVPVPGSTERCFGPFNTNVPIPYGIVTLDDGNGYNPSWGVFTAHTPGVYTFSFTVYSNVAEKERIYHKVQLMKNDKAMVSVWENNREDGEDSATQVVILDMKKGDQVYVELMAGRKLCSHLEFNIFTGYMLYPHVDK